MTWLGGARAFVGRAWRWLRRERPAHDLLVVRKGLSPAYYFFCKMFAQERGLVMVLDRRRGSRRRRQRPTPTIERRSDDRRKPESHLDSDDFCVVKVSETKDPSPQRTRRKN